MGTTQIPKASPSALWQRHMRGTQAWIGSGFRDESGARTAAKALEEWLGGYPNQAADIGRIALASAFTAMTATAYEPAAAFAAVAVDASTFRPLATQDDCAAAALASLILAESRLEAEAPSRGASPLQYARALLDRMGVTSALRAWVHAQCELIAGVFAEALLEMRQAAAHYETARNIVEPLIRNPRLRKELTNDWLRVVYGNMQVTVAPEKVDKLVQDLVRSQYVLTALASARTSAPEHATTFADIAAAACAEFGVARTISPIDVHAALNYLPNETRLATLDSLLARFQPSSDLKSKAMTAMLLGLRANTPSNTTADDDFKRAGDAAHAAADGYAWTTLAADMIEHHVRLEGKSPHGLFERFLMAYANAEEDVRRTPRHLPFRAHFERTLRLATADALNSFTAAPSLGSSAHLSACLEASRTPAVQFDIHRARQSPTKVQQAHVTATDWLGRIVHAIKHRPDALVLIPVALPQNTTLLCIADNITGGIEAHAASDEFAAAATTLSQLMRQHFEAKQSQTDLRTPGRKVYEALPGRVQELLRDKRTVLVVPDLSAEQSAVPYELFHGPEDFLGIECVVARFLSLRDVAFVLESSLLPTSPVPRALCVAAPNTVPEQPLRFANNEVDRVRKCLMKAKWSVPALKEAQLTPDLLLNGLECGALVHIAAHGEAFGSSHAILLPRGERLVTDAVASHHGELSAAVYLSTCSVGASEYLGGGVTRGFAAALAAKGAPAIIASQWPLQDAAAEHFAVAFYEAALENTIGEAIRTTRKRLAETVAPALWGSLILIGNPWHRLGASEASQNDAATELLRVATDPSASRKVRQVALDAAAKAQKIQPDDRRLAAAITWANEVGTLFGGQDPTLSAEWAEQMANVARDLGSSSGEVFCHMVAADLLHADGHNAHACASLDRAIDVSEGIARRDDNWDAVLRGLLAQREKMSLDFEVPEIKLCSGMTINNRSDPTVRAVFETQHALDQQDTRRSSELQPRLPDRSLQDLCWNSVVLGQRNRFPDEFACAGFAQQLAARAAASGWIDHASEADARRVAAGLLRFLWSSQRMTHLEHKVAIGQARTLLFALDALGHDRAPMDSKGTQEQARIEQLGEQLIATANTSPGDRFARARDRLRQKTTAQSIALEKAVSEYVAEATPGSALQAHRASWAFGLLLELAYKSRLKGQEALAELVLTACAGLKSEAMGHFIAYLREGFAEVQSMPLDPLGEWKCVVPRTSN